MHSGELKQQAPEVAFLFPGQGSQYVNMGKELYQQEPAFRREIDACTEILQHHLSLDIRNLLFPADDSEEAANQLEQTEITQPALFAIEYALARLWAEWGIKPSAMLGHSIGEYVAACLAGVFSLEEALKVVALRGRLMQSVPPGAMLAVRLSESELADFLNPEISIAAINSPGNSVVSGTLQAIAELEKKFERQGVAFGRLHTSHAFHSAMMEPVVAALVEAMSGIELHPPQIPYVSNVTGRWITPAEATDPQYWGEHLRRTVRFADGIRELAEEPNRVLLECGPGHTLSALARQQSSHAITVSCMPHAREQVTESFTIARALGKLWLTGTEIDWNSFYAYERRRRVPLPLYPFERQRYWIKSDGTGTHSRSLDDWLYVPCWRPAGLLQNRGRKIESPVLIFADETGFANRLAKSLRKEGNTVVTVSAGTAFVIGSESNYSLNPCAKQDYKLLLDNLARTGLAPRTVVHAWNVTAAANSSEFIWADARCRSFDSLIFLAEALEAVAPGAEVRLCVLSNNMQKTGVEHVLHPEKAMLLGPVKVIPQEYPNISCKSIDIVLPDFDGATEDLIDDLIIDLATCEKDLVAYRSGQRWTRGVASFDLAPEDATARPLKQNGVYLITGGLGGIGLTFAETLASRVQARLILTGRSSFPEQSVWEEWISTHPENDECSQVIRRLRSIQKLGAEVMVLSADVADRETMQAAVRRAEEHFGPIDGVVHAAGVPGGGLIQLKTGELADKVLKPKVQGTLVLHSIFRERQLDFFVLCSSINSIIGGFGQSDYAAANAFCDAFAQAHFQHRGCYTVSINWDRWNEVGMTARRFSAEDLLLPRFFQNGSNNNQPDTGHALLGRLVNKFPDSLVNVADFGPDKQWVLSEHKIAGHPIVPGTTYLEMARAMFAQQVPATPLTIEKAVFPTPLIVHEGETRSVVTLLRQSGEKFLFRVLSKPKTNASSQSEWQEHASGEVALTNGAGPGRTLHDVARLIQSFEGNGRATEKQLREPANGKFIATGPRWDVLKAVYVGQAECLALLELPEKFAEDLDRYWLHPAVLDVATGFVHFLAEGDYLPLLYERITIWAPLARKVFSHVHLRSDLKKNSDVITSDISILDTNGAELVRLEGFSMKRVREAALAEWQQPASHIKERTPVEELATRSFGP
ncbi:MAG TPA: SDR family NAD(P)-dependent oxidoreductase, partial [Candidatus Angelobacter sp.]|nr:SDR family NAD(P)-dependent oxidoreductase [Candidatus Angelobacter sp.]